MAEYCGVIQSITRLRRNVYKLTFRVHVVGTEDEEEMEVAARGPHMFEAEIRLRDGGFTAVPDEKLDECLGLLEEYPDAALLGKDVYRKWIVGKIADEMFDRLREDMTLSPRSWKEIEAFIEQRRSDDQ